MKLRKMMILLSLMSMLFSHALAKQAFDLSVFEREQGIIRSDTQMWLINADEKNATGKIWPNVTGKDYDSFEDRTAIEIGVCILLENYGTPDFNPVPRIEVRFITYAGLVVDDAVFTIGDKSFTFNHINVKTRESSGSLYEILYLLCQDGEFMDAWIENDGQVKMTLKGANGEFDWIVTDDMRRNIALLFKDYRKAGGYDYLDGPN